MDTHTNPCPTCQYCGQQVAWMRPRGFGEFVHISTGSYECPEGRSAR